MQARGQGGVWVTPHRHGQTQGSACGAVFAFAHHRQRRGGHCVAAGDARGKVQRLLQALFQRGHVDDPAQRAIGASGGHKTEFGALIASGPVDATLALPHVVDAYIGAVPV